MPIAVIGACFLAISSGFTATRAFRIGWSVPECTVNEKKPLFLSVVIPVHNRAGTIGRALESIRNQSFSNYEVVIMDDRSTDNLRDVLESFMRGNVRCFRTVGCLGQHCARWQGVAWADGTYIFPMDSDDEVTGDVFAVLFEKVRARSVAPDIVSYRVLLEGGRQTSLRAWPGDPERGDLEFSGDSLRKKFAALDWPYNLWGKMILRSKYMLAMSLFTHDELYMTANGAIDLMHMGMIFLVTESALHFGGVVGYKYHEETPVSVMKDKDKPAMLRFAYSFMREKLLTLKGLDVPWLTADCAGRARQCMRERKKEVRWSSRRGPDSKSRTFWASGRAR